jgi:ribosomal protein L40E
MVSKGENVFQEISLEGQAPAPSPQDGFVFHNYHKAGLLILVAAVLYLRLTLRKRKNDKICPHCEYRNPYHRSNCTKCGAPLLDLSFRRGG